MGERLIVVGNGMVATRFVEELTRGALGRYSIMVVGAEPRPSYNRVLLSSLLAGEIDEDGIELRSQSWWRASGVTLLHGQEVAAIDRADRQMVLANGLRFAYSKVVLATGSVPIRLPKPGMDLPGVVTFRDIADVQAMRAAARTKARAVVIGGGLLGIETAHGLAKAGIEVTLVHLMDRLMERQLDAPAAALLRRALEAKGVEVLLHADTARVVGTKRAEGLELTGGHVIPADLVVCAVGVRPNVGLARATGLGVGRGILVNDRLATNCPDVFALGECAEHRGQLYGLVEPGYEQAKVLAQRLAGNEGAIYPGSTLATNLKVTGVNVFSAGEFAGSASDDVILLEDEGAGTYRKLVLAEDRLKGVVLFGDTADGLWYLDLIRSGADISGLRDALAFGRAFALPQAA